MLVAEERLFFRREVPRLARGMEGSGLGPERVAGGTEPVGVERAVGADDPVASVARRVAETCGYVRKRKYRKSRARDVTCVISLGYAANRVV